MAVLAWDTNAYYQRLLLRKLPRSCQRVLDVGCGAGAFAARLAQHSAQVDAVDRAAVMIEEARRRTPGNVSCVLADVLTDPLPGTAAVQAAPPTRPPTRARYRPPA